MSRNPELQKQIKIIINKAQRSLKAAKKLLNYKDYDFASSRAYYTAFYSIEALLLIENLTSSKHAGIISLFNQYYIKTDIFPKEFSKIISRLFRDRQIGDYEFEVLLSSVSTKNDIKDASKILNRVIDYLKENNFLN